jgi:hypothetical protein
MARIIPLKSFACSICSSFLFHGIQDIADDDYGEAELPSKARASFGRRDAFFWALRYEVSRYLHMDWHILLLTVAGVVS